MASPGVQELSGECSWMETEQQSPGRVISLLSHFLILLYNQFLLI